MKRSIAFIIALLMLLPGAYVFAVSGPAYNGSGAAAGHGSMRDEPNSPSDALLFDFESDPLSSGGWSVNDGDGDGRSWRWVLSGEDGFEAYDGEGLMASFFYYSDSQGVLAPDNWLYSPAFTAGESIEFYAKSQVESASGLLTVYVSNDGGKSWDDDVLSFMTRGQWTKYAFDTTDYIGQEIMLAFRHHGSSALFSICLDNVAVLKSHSEPTATATPKPTNVVFGLNKCSARPGEQAAIELTLDGSYAASGFTMDVAYDSTKLTLNSVIQGEVLDQADKDKEMVLIVDDTPGIVSIGLLCPRKSISAVGRIVTMYFTVSESARPGEKLPINVNVHEFFYMPAGSERLDLGFSIKNGSVTVLDPALPSESPSDAPKPSDTPEPSDTSKPSDMPNPSDTPKPSDTPEPGTDAPQIKPNGDLDGDGRATMIDATAVLRKSLGLIQITAEQLARCDMNMDGSISATDAVVIMRLAMGLVSL